MTERHLIKINITRWIMKPRPNTWWDLATCVNAWRRVILKKISTAQNLCAYGSQWILTGVIWPFEFTENETKNSNIHHTWINCLKPTMYLINIQYNIIIIDCMGNCHPSKKISTSASPRSTLVFSGWEFPMLPSHAVWIMLQIR